MIRGLRLDAHVGVTEDERARPQPLELNIELDLDLGPAGKSDELSETVDYGEVTALVAGVVGEQRCNLLERLARLVADSIVVNYPVSRVSVEIMKLEPPVDQEVTGLGVRIERTRA